jgi:hypothetical protein
MDGWDKGGRRPGRRMRVPEMRDDRSSPGRSTLFSDELPELQYENGPEIEIALAGQTENAGKEEFLEPQEGKRKCPSMNTAAHLVAASRKSGREWESAAALYNVSVAESAVWKRSSPSPIA